MLLGSAPHFQYPSWRVRCLLASLKTWEPLCHPDLSHGLSELSEYGNVNPKEVQRTKSSASLSSCLFRSFAQHPHPDPALCPGRLPRVDDINRHPCLLASQPTEVSSSEDGEDGAFPAGLPSRQCRLTKSLYERSQLLPGSPLHKDAVSTFQ